MDLVIYSALALIYLFLVIRIAAQLSGKRQWLNYAIFQIFVLFSLAYDNGIIAAGRFIGEGELLMGLSSVRFWLHAFATPTLVLVGYYILRSSQVKFSKHIITHIAAWVITVGLIIYQISSTLQEVESLIPMEEYGVLRYTSESLAGPPFMVIIVGSAVVNRYNRSSKTKMGMAVCWNLAIVCMSSDPNTCSKHSCNQYI